MTENYARATDAEYEQHVTVVSEVPDVALSAEVSTKLVPGTNLTLSFASVPPGAIGAVHSHPHEQMIVVLSGKIDIMISGKTYRATEGNVVWIPGGLEHTGIGLDEPCRMLEIFTPARKDFEEKLKQAYGAP